MPEPNKRVVVRGIRQAEQEVNVYAGKRLDAEKSIERLERELRELERRASRPGLRR